MCKLVWLLESFCFIFVMCLNRGLNKDDANLVLDEVWVVCFLTFLHSTLSCMSTLGCRALCDSDADLHRQGQWDGADDWVSSRAREWGGPHARRLAEVLLPGHQTDIWLWCTTLLSFNFTYHIILAVFSFLFFLPYVQMSTWNVTLLKNRLTIAPCFTFWFCFMCLKKKIRKEMYSYNDWHEVRKVESQSHSFHLCICVRNVFIVAQ